MKETFIPMSEFVSSNKGNNYEFTGPAYETWLGATGDILNDFYRKTHHEDPLPNFFPEMIRDYALILLLDKNRGLSKEESLQHALIYYASELRELGDSGNRLSRIEDIINGWAPEQEESI